MSYDTRGNSSTEQNITPPEKINEKLPRRFVTPFHSTLVNDLHDDPYIFSLYAQVHFHAELSYEKNRLSHKRTSGATITTVIVHKVFVRQSVCNSAKNEMCFTYFLNQFV